MSDYGPPFDDHDDDEYIDARDVLEGEELHEQLRTGRTRIRRQQ
jgi:hypothetical protein